MKRGSDEARERNRENSVYMRVMFGGKKLQDFGWTGVCVCPIPIFVCCLARCMRSVRQNSCWNFLSWFFSWFSLLCICVRLFGCRCLVRRHRPRLAAFSLHAYAYTNDVVGQIPHKQWPHGPLAQLYPRLELQIFQETSQSNNTPAKNYNARGANIHEFRTPTDTHNGNSFKYGSLLKKASETMGKNTG